MKNKRLSQGFSLVEVLFTIVFLSVIVFGVIKLETSNLTLGNTQNQNLKAHFWANHGLSIVEAIGMDDIVCVAESCEQKISEAPPYALGNEGEGLIDGVFNRTIKIEPLGISGGEVKINPGAGSISAYKVTSLIEWTDNAGDHEVRVKRIIH